MKPKRIQRKRTKGWKMPTNTVYVGRPSKWGNPFKPKTKNDIAECVMAYQYWIEQKISVGLLKNLKEELRGKDLACWCKEGEPCHADVLLRLANEEV